MGPVRLVRTGLFSSFVVAALAGGTAASAGPLRPFGETITYSSGACLDNCAIYKVSVLPNGRVTIGNHRARYVTRAAYRELVAALRPYRPATGTTEQTVCNRQTPNESVYRITWTGRAGTTTLEHNFGCASPRNAVLNAILVGNAARVGVRETPVSEPVKPALPKPHIFYF